MTARIALVTPHPRSHRTAEETLALGYLAAVLIEHGYDAYTVDGWLRGYSTTEIVTAIVKGGVPDVVAMSCYESNLNESIELLEAIREACGPIPVVCGGYGPTFADEKFLRAGFTVAVRGEAEHVIVPLVEALLKQAGMLHVPGVSFLKERDVQRNSQCSPLMELDGIPFPTREEMEWAARANNPIHMCTARGCKAYCTFCSIHAFAAMGSSKALWRQRSIPNIVDELKALQASHGVTYIKFVDDSFIEPPRDAAWAEAFANAVLREGLRIRFRTQIRADRVTEDLVFHLKRAGWFATSVGVENMSPSALKRMGKAADPEQNKRALDILQKHGIYVQMGMILFDHATSMDELEENCCFLETQKWVVTKGVFTEMFAAKGTAFKRLISQRGLVQKVGAHQNAQYLMQDAQTARVHRILKKWHASHARVYDWVIDSITAPKVLPDEGYQQVHRLCRQLLDRDSVAFRASLNHVREHNSEQDSAFVEGLIQTNTLFYTEVEVAIAGLYRRFGLVYTGVLNPFL